MFTSSLIIPAPSLTKARPSAQKRRVACLTSHICTRHRQTPIAKHDKKTRHVITTQRNLRTPLCYLEIGDFCTSVIRCCVRPAGGALSHARRFLCRFPVEAARPESAPYHGSDRDGLWQVSPPILKIIRRSSRYSRWRMPAKG